MINPLNISKLRLEMGDYVLSLQGVSTRRWGRGSLRRVDLDVKRGAAVALLGPRGAGKSLTLACIAGMVRPARGRIRYLGYEIGGRAQVRVAQVGIVRVGPRPPRFGALRVLECVTVGALVRTARVAVAEQRAREVLAVAGLADRERQVAATLTAAERSRLALARALATRPQVLLLDDPAAALDLDGKRALGDALAAARTESLAIVVAARALDDLPIVPDAVVSIDAGQTAAPSSRTEAPADRAP